MVKYKINLILLFFWVIVCVSCDRKPNITTNNEIVKDALRLGFKIALGDSLLTDWEKTRDSIGRYTIFLSGDTTGINKLKEVEQYSFNVLDSNNICSIGNGKYYLIVKRPEIKSDTVIFRLYSDCVYKTKDTCISRLFCGGGIKLIMKKVGENLVVTDTIGSSN